jgi:hypothetical protein
MMRPTNNSAGSVAYPTVKIKENDAPTHGDQGLASAS